MRSYLIWLLSMGIAASVWWDFTHRNEPAVYKVPEAFVTCWVEVSADEGTTWMRAYTLQKDRSLVAPVGGATLIRIYCR